MIKMILEIALLFIMFFAAVLGLLVFIFKNMLYIILSLMFIFLISAFLFFMLNQPLLAILQIIISVGGISTYMFVTVASIEFSKFKFSSFAKVGLLSAIVFAIIVYPLKTIFFTESGMNVITQQIISSTMTNQIFNIFIISLVLFGTSIGSIILLKKLNK